MCSRTGKHGYASLTSVSLSNFLTKICNCSYYMEIGSILVTFFYSRGQLHFRWWLPCLHVFSLCVQWVYICCHTNHREIFLCVFSVVCLFSILSVLKVESKSSQEMFAVGIWIFFSTAIHLDYIIALSSSAILAFSL